MAQIGQSAGGQLLWVAAKVLVTLFLGGMVTMATGYVKDMRDDLRVASTKIDAQDKAQALMQQRIGDMGKVSDATVTALQALSIQVNHNTYDVGTLKTFHSLEEKPK